MPRKAIGSDRTAEDLDKLNAIVESVGRRFDTVEDMTQSFIREAIMTGVFAPGQRLNLDAIAATLGVSRMPVRNGLRQLEGEGLIQVSPYRGATVSVLEPAEIAEIYELRILLECFLIERAIPHLDEEVLEQLHVSVSELEASAEGPWLDRRRSFYHALYELAERPRALAQVNKLRGSVGRYLLLQRLDEGHGHEDLLEYLHQRDVDGAKQWLASHLTRVSETLQGLVAQQDL
jgi:DNA-binding GntR family transcriptional regulator